MELKAVRYEVDDQIATVTLSRPHRRNAWTGRMHHEIRWAVAEAEADPSVRAVIVTGEGSDFCVGADASALEGHVDKGGYDPGTPIDLPWPGQGVHPAFGEHFSWMMGVGVPIVAAVNGAAAGVGLVLACFSDLRWAAAGAKLTTAHGKLNLPVEYGLSWVLARQIGQTRAAELLLTSRIFTAEEALGLGLLNGVLPADELLPHVRAVVAEMIATCSPRSLRETKRQIWLDLLRDVGEAVRHSDRLLDEMTTEPDYVEGVRAWREKRPPEWTGSA